MSPNQRFALIMTGLSALITLVGFCIKLLWTASSRWQRTTDTLQVIGEKIEDLVVAKEKEHNRLEARLDKHEKWFYEQRQQGTRRRGQQQ
jgi:hypothetical protein